jgi:hypothetical protein
MDWKDLGAKIASYAPALGSILGSVIPGAGTAIGGAVGLGIKALAGMLGITSQDPTADELNAALGPIDPETALKLKVADQTFTLEMSKVEMEELKIQLADVQNARSREIAMKGSNTTFYSIGWIITLSFFGAIVLIIFKPLGIAGEMRDVLNMMLGYLASNFTTVVSYFYGSSKGSADKAIAMDKTTTALATKIK